MPLSSTSTAPGLDDAEAIRHADADLLSLALIDARNVSLRWLSLLEEHKLLHEPIRMRTAARRIGHAAWYQEWLVARNVQRHRGDGADAELPRLASVDEAMSDWFMDRSSSASPDAARLRDYMALTLDATLDLLAVAPGTDEGLFAFRAALLHEDRMANGLAEHALVSQWPVPLPPLAARVDREPIWMPAQRIQLGSRRGGFVPANERWAHEVLLPEFEIDAQLVDWARYIPFAEDGGYDQRGLWSEAGWDWVQRVERRAPRNVEQLRGGAVVMRQGRLARAPAQQAVVHVSRHEAEAWCRWAGRRLATEPEWELAACTAASRGFAWGDAFEWVAGSGRPWPGYAPTPDALDLIAEGDRWGMARGASWLCRGRLKHPRGRRALALDADHVAIGFRSCAV